MRILKTSIFVLFVSISINLTAQNARVQKQTFFEKWKNDSLLKNTSIGVSVVDANNQQIIMETEPQLSLVPASTLKLVTSAAALEILGYQYHFETLIDYSGEIKDKGVLNGDLIIVGGGDPALGSSYFKEHYLKNNFIDQWVQKIQEKGIKTVKGDLVADASIYEEQMIPNTWIWEDIGNYYGAGACGLSSFDNMYEIYLQSGIAGSLSQIINIEPKIPGLQITNEVKASEIDRDMAYVFGSPFDNKRVIRGTIAENRESLKIKASIPNPPFFLASLLKQKLEASNIQVKGTIKTSYIPSDKNKKIICNTISPALKEIIKVLNHESVNLFAEHLCKHLAYIETGKGNTSDGVDIIKKFWEQKGIDVNSMHLNDGSGLSRFNAITARQLTNILFYMSQCSVAEIFKQSLPTVGESGTLYVFDEDKFPNGSLRAKSGSMTRVRCYSGFLKTKSGKELIFTVMLNNFSCTQSQAIKKIEELLFELYKE